MDERDDSNINTNTFKNLCGSLEFPINVSFSYGLFCISASILLRSSKEDYQIVALIQIVVTFVKSIERHDHVFINCAITKEIWDKIKYTIKWHNHFINISFLCQNIYNTNQKNRKGIIIFSLIVAALWI